MLIHNDFIIVILKRINKLTVLSAHNFNCHYGKY